MRKFGFKAIMTMVAGVMAAVLFTVTASAMTPTLSLVNNGYGLMQVTVYGDANAPIILDYYSGSELLGAGVIGTTNYSGYFSESLNSENYDIPNGAEAVVVVNGQQSSAATWTGSSNNNYNNGGNGSLSLSQTNVSLATGQTTTVTSYNTTGSLYISSNSNNSVANATVYGNSIDITAENYGSTTLSICSSYSGCSSIYITVSSSSYETTTPITLSQTSTTLTVGQSQTIYIDSNYNNNEYNTNEYYLSNLSSGIVTGSVSGNAITLYGQNAGSTTVTVCSSNEEGYYGNNGNGCASLYVTVNGNYSYPTYPTYPTYPVYNTTPISVSNSNVQLTVGNTGTVTLYGGNNDYYNGDSYYNNSEYYISNNGTAIADATVNGSTISIYGQNPGSTTITVCGSNGGSSCATINVTVTAQNYYYNTGYQNSYPEENNNGWYYSNQNHCWQQYN
jgi:hypothetical protein